MGKIFTGCEVNLGYLRAMIDGEPKSGKNMETEKIENNVNHRKKASP